MIAQEVFEITMALADEIDDTGAINPTNTASYRVRTPGILTSLQSELIKSGDLYKTFEISNKPANNLFGMTAGFDYIEITDEWSREVVGSAKAYYFEVDGECTVYIEDYTGAWNTLATVVVPNTVVDFTGYKGAVTPTTGATKSRIRIVPTYRLLLTNYCLFSANFAPSKVPDYRPWVLKQMPADFKSVDQIVNEFPQRQYSKDTMFKWEGRKDLYINYYYEGSIRIVYRPVPSPITSMASVLELDDVTSRTLLPYGLGMELFKEENSEIYTHFKRRFDELKALSIVKQPASEQAIFDFYGGS